MRRREELLGSADWGRQIAEKWGPPSPLGVSLRRFEKDDIHCFIWKRRYRRSYYCPSTLGATSCGSILHPHSQNSGSATWLALVNKPWVKLICVIFQAEALRVSEWFPLLWWLAVFQTANALSASAHKEENGNRANPGGQVGGVDSKTIIGSPKPKGPFVNLVLPDWFGWVLFFKFSFFHSELPPKQIFSKFSAVEPRKGTHPGSLRMHW